MNTGFIKGIEHGVASLILFAIPIVLMNDGGWQGITIGAALNGLYAWARAYSAVQ